MFSSSYSIEKTIMIAQPAALVFEKIADLKFWPQWSPWYNIEPDCEYFADENKGQVGHKQKWSGKFIGSGEMTIISLVPNKEINFELEFLAPFKSKSLTSFLVEEKNGQTQVTWTMSSALPFFLFFLKNIMAGMIGQDFERGLLMLKDVLEKGELPSQIKVIGEVECEGFYYVGMKIKTPINDISTPVRKAFTHLNSLVIQKQIPPPEYSLSISHHFDFVKNVCEITAAMGFNHPTALADTIIKDLNLVQGEVPKHKAYRVDHVGAYRFIRNAWAALMSRHRALKFKENKKIAPYEIYRTLPEDVNSGRVLEKDYLTEIMVPLR